MFVADEYCILSGMSTSDYYDIIYADWVPESQTLSELEYIKSHISKDSSILDIGSGTGRHLIPLAKDGYQVTGIDKQEDMIAVLTKKYPQADVIHSSFLDHNFGDVQYDLVTCLWNVLNELALTENDLEIFASKLSHILRPEGKAWIILSDSENFKPAEYSFVHKVVKHEMTYELDWELLEYDDQTQTSEARERIQIRDSDGIIVKEVQAQIVQRWWKIGELTAAFQSAGLKIESKLESDYFHLLLTR